MWMTVAAVFHFYLGTEVVTLASIVVNYLAKTNRIVSFAK